LENLFYSTHTCWFSCHFAFALLGNFQATKVRWNVRVNGYAPENEKGQSVNGYAPESSDNKTTNFQK